MSGLKIRTPNRTFKNAPFYDFCAPEESVVVTFRNFLQFLNHKKKFFFSRSSLIFSLCIASDAIIFDKHIFKSIQLWGIPGWVLKLCGVKGQWQNYAEIFARNENFAGTEIKRVPAQLFKTSRKIM